MTKVTRSVSISSITYSIMMRNTSTISHHGLRHGCDEALPDNNPRHGRLLERLGGAPLRPDWQPQRPLVLLLALERER